jgi:hypothetical protein
LNECVNVNISVISASRRRFQNYVELLDQNERKMLIYGFLATLDLHRVLCKSKYGAQFAGRKATVSEIF